MQKADVAIVGGGIVGLATAYHLTQKFPDRRVVVLEKEKEVAQHQTGHNSGVLHSGIYYKPGSIKEKTCRLGKAAMESFCEREGIRYDLCGKVIVATSERELPLLGSIYLRGQKNGVSCRMIEADELKEIEPHTAGIRAIHVPEAGIVDYKQVCAKLAERIQEKNGDIKTGFHVEDIEKTDEGYTLRSSSDEVQATYLITCGGLFSDRLATLSGSPPGIQVVPFRGEYFILQPEAEYLCNGLIYPVPDPDFPFLGVHFTKIIQGGVECGPNAVLSLAREGYKKTDIDLSELFEIVQYKGFQRLVQKHWKQGLGELWRSFNKAAFVKALQKLVPDIKSEHLRPAPAGVRAQAMNKDGTLVDDFFIIESENAIHVCNAPSPAATASLEIGKVIVDTLEKQLE